MKSLEELLDHSDPAISIVRKWVSNAMRPVELLPPSTARVESLVRTQVTTRSPMGAIVYETGGILVDNGWLRILGSGHPRLTRTLPGWNQGRSNGFYLVADDAVGGFFAINGGALGADQMNLYRQAIRRSLRDELPAVVDERGGKIAASVRSARRGSMGLAVGYRATARIEIIPRLGDSF